MDTSAKHAAMNVI